MEPLSWFDTHAHVCDSKFDPDRDEVIERAFTRGLRGFIEIADGPKEWEKASRLAERHDNKIWWAAGFHPYYADKASQNLLISLKNISKHRQFVAIGEIGLDYAKCPISPEIQLSTLQATLDLAYEIQKPLIIHCREAFHDLLPVLKKRFSSQTKKGSPGVVHCFSGTLREAEELVDMGFFLGVDGPLTYPKSTLLREVVTKIPVENIVIETDSPYLPPQGFRGQRNQPAYTELIGHQLAIIRKIDPHELSRTLLINTSRLFRLKHLEN